MSGSSLKKDFTMKKIIAVTAVIATLAPAIAFAGPSLGLAYSDVGLSGHSGRPGISIGASSLYSNNVDASGSATFARGFYQVHAKIGKRIPASGVIVEPYVSMGFINANYSQRFQPSVSDFYGLAGADMYVPIGKRVSVELGGGYGHTLMAFGGSSGAVYRGKAALNFGIAKRVFGDLQATYLHVPGQSVTEYGAGISYHFS